MAAYGISHLHSVRLGLPTVRWAALVAAAGIAAVTVRRSARPAEHPASPGLEPARGEPAASEA